MIACQHLEQIMEEDIIKQMMIDNIGINWKIV